MIKIDGSFGEGGGQILRTSLALSMCCGRPFSISNIRAGRKKPGLMRQHLTAVNAAKAISGATVLGAEISSQDLEFQPGPVQSGSYSFAIGTAGSATLVLQTVLPPLLLARETSVIRLEGGTHNPHSPPFHFLRDAFLPVLSRMGAECHAEISRWGFFPAGGGRFEVTINPASAGLDALHLIERGNLIAGSAFAGVAKVPWEVANDECSLLVKGARFPIGEKHAEEVPSPGPGNVAMLTLKYEHIQVVFTGFGQLGVSRKAVAHGMTTAANRFHQAGAAVDDHLADQILIPMALAGLGSFTTTEPTLHTKTNARVIEEFLGVKTRFEQLEKNLWKISIGEGRNGNGMDQG